jgi:hypothetical protein
VGETGGVSDPETGAGKGAVAYACPLMLRAEGIGHPDASSPDRSKGTVEPPAALAEGEAEGELEADGVGKGPSDDNHWFVAP